MSSSPVSSETKSSGRPGWRVAVARPRRDLRTSTRESSTDGPDRSSFPGDAGLLRRFGAPVDLLGCAVFLGFLVLLLAKAPGLDYFLTSRDHGYQLSVGTQVLMGKVPGVDIVCAYGPLAMYTSAFGLWVSRSLTGETVICASGYALCLFLIYRLVAVYSSRPMGLAAAGFGFLLAARFYKWYVWLIPLGTLWVLHRYLSSSVERRPRWIVAVGLLGGLCWLFRPDMGTTLVAANLVFLTTIEAGSRPRDLRRVIRAQALFLASFLVTLVAWFGYLAIGVGAHGPLTYLKRTAAGALSVATGMAQPLHFEGAVVLAYVLGPATLLLGAVIGLRREIAGRGDRRSRFLLASSLVGLGVVHQAMHRMDPQHLLQVIAPIIVCGFVGLSVFLGRWADGFPGGLRSWGLLATGLVYYVLLACVGLALTSWGCQDLVAFSPWPAQRYSDLAHPLDAPDRFPVVKAMRVIREQTGPSEPILVFPLDCQFYAISHRRISGRLHGYYAGVLDAPRFHAGNLDAIRNDMPSLVIVPSTFKQAPGDATLDLLERRSREAHDYVEAFIRERYTRVVYDDGQILMLRR